jgi:hypothetical protein
MVYFESSVFHSPVAAALDLEVYWTSKIMPGSVTYRVLGMNWG